MFLFFSSGDAEDTGKALETCTWRKSRSGSIFRLNMALSSKTASPDPPFAPSPMGTPKITASHVTHHFIWSLIKPCLKRLPHQECEATQTNYTLTVLQCYNVIEYPQMGETFNGEKYNLLLGFWGFYIFTFAKLSKRRNRRLTLKLINSISGYVRNLGCVNLNSRILFN